MKYLGKQVNGYATRNNFVRSMDLASNRSPDAALEAYCRTWFSSTRKQYLNEALKFIADRSLFWPKKAMTDMLDEVALQLAEDQDVDQKQLAKDMDRVKARFNVWGQNRASQPLSLKDVTEDIKGIEKKYRYRCPDTYRSCWMNTGAYIALSYSIKYEGLVLPRCKGPDDSLSLLKRCALEVIADMDHDVDERLFRLAYQVYAPGAAMP